MDLSGVAGKAREILKALGGKDPKPAEGEKPPVPTPPEDADRLDSRVGDASPSQEDLDDAKAKGGDEGGQGGEGGEFDENGHQDLDPDDLGAGEGGDKGGEGEGGDKGKGEGEGREVKKAMPNQPSFPFTGHMLPDDLDGDLDEIETPNMDAIFKSFFEQFQKQNEVMGRMVSVLEKLEKGADIQARELKKALDASAAITVRLDKLHETAPAAGAPRGLAKSMTPAPVAPGFEPSMTVAEVQRVAETGQMSPIEIAMLCQSAGR